MLRIFFHKLLFRQLYTALALLSMLVLPTAGNADDECVILLHGLGRTASSMQIIDNALTSEGFKVWNQTYASTEADIKTLAKSAIEPAVDFCGSADKIHFVTHSLGGILVRYFLQKQPFNGRIVMIAPPNQGSEIPDVMGEIKLFQKILGPSGLQLGTSDDSIPNTLDQIQGEIGIIAGERTSDPWFSWLIPGPDDGKVSVASTRLEEMTDWLVVPHGHTFIMRDRDVIKQIKYFLAKGQFLKH